MLHGRDLADLGEAEGGTGTTPMAAIDTLIYFLEHMRSISVVTATARIRVHPNREVLAMDQRS